MTIFMFHLLRCSKRSFSSQIKSKQFEYLYGTEPVLAALHSARRKQFGTLFVLKSLLNNDVKHNSTSRHQSRRSKISIETVRSIAEPLGIQLRPTDRHDLNMMSQNRPHNGLVLEASELPTAVLKGINIEKAIENLQSFSTCPIPLWIFLDEVMDPQNLGAIIRSSFFLGAYQIIVCKRNSSALSPVVSKASGGALEYAKIAYCDSMTTFLRTCKESGHFDIYALDMSETSIPLEQVKLTKPTILLIGNEGYGIRKMLLKECDQIVSIGTRLPSTHFIPPELRVDSLNVSSAVAAALFHLTRSA